MNLVNNIKRYLHKHGPTILTCLSAAGVITTAVLAVKETPKAIHLLEEAEKEKGEELTKAEIVKVAAPVYLPSVISGVSTVVCIFSANMLNKKHQASLASAYALLDNSYKEYKKMLLNTYGKDVDLAVRQSIAKDKYEHTSVEDNKILFYDEFSSQYFESTMENVKNAEYLINRDLITAPYVYLNHFYKYLGIPTIEGGWSLGWSKEACTDIYWQNWIDFEHEKVVMDDGLEVYIIRMIQEPVMDF